ncbi:MAG: hypothetical protein JXB32_12545 [Deltaproteobacteria bacterium]|nr:hypothetical protein [Deltaproteobacteria bacterium]
MNLRRHLTITISCVLFIAAVAADADPSADPVVATVNGQPIRQQVLVDILLRGRGSSLLEDLVRLEVVRQHAALENIQPSDGLLTDEWSRILDDMAPGKPRDTQNALLDYMLQSRGLTRPEFALVVERRALLRQLVASHRLEISPAELESEFQVQFGRKLEVRALAVQSPRRLEQAQQRLAQGEDFAAVAAEFTEYEPLVRNGCLWGPFPAAATADAATAATADVPEPVRTVALALSDPGQRSEPFQFSDNNTQWHAILCLQRILPAADVSFDSVQDQLRDVLRERKTQQRMLNLGAFLRQEAAVRILHSFDAPNSDPDSAPTER